MLKILFFDISPYISDSSPSFSPTIPSILQLRYITVRAKRLLGEAFVHSVNSMVYGSYHGRYIMIIMIYPDYSIPIQILDIYSNFFITLPMFIPFPSFTSGVSWLLSAFQCIRGAPEGHAKKGHHKTHHLLMRNGIPEDHRGGAHDGHVLRQRVDDPVGWSDGVEV